MLKPSGVESAKQSPRGTSAKHGGGRWLTFCLHFFFFIFFPVPTMFLAVFKSHNSLLERLISNLSDLST